jgi:putative acetyltransferase
MISAALDIKVQGSLMAPMLIRIDDLAGPEIAALLTAHAANMEAWSPPGTTHFLNLAALRTPEVTMWSAWLGNEIAACGAIKELDGRHGEIKSMHTAARFRRDGIATRLLAHMIGEARSRNYQRLSLETGSYPAFAPARDLYGRHGFVVCGAFGDYEDAPTSTFMTLALP